MKKVTSVAGALSVLALAAWTVGAQDHGPGGPSEPLALAPVVAPEPDVSVPETPIPSAQWTPEARLWFVRSCVGEAGFWNPQECAAMGWVYANRIRGTRVTFERMVRQYSAAVRRRPSARPWLWELVPTLEEPEGWPDRKSVV